MLSYTVLARFCAYCSKVGNCSLKWPIACKFSTWTVRQVYRQVYHDSFNSCSRALNPSSILWTEESVWLDTVPMISEGLYSFSKVLFTFSTVSFKKLSSVSSLEIASSKEGFWAFWCSKWMENGLKRSPKCLKNSTAPSIYLYILLDIVELGSVFKGQSDCLLHYLLSSPSRI